MVQKEKTKRSYNQRIMKFNVELHVSYLFFFGHPLRIFLMPPILFPANLKGALQSLLPFRGVLCNDIPAAAAGEGDDRRPGAGQTPEDLGQLPAAGRTGLEQLGTKRVSTCFEKNTVIPEKMMHLS